eukprot:gene6581-3233_t
MRLAIKLEPLTTFDVASYRATHTICKLDIMMLKQQAVTSLASGRTCAPLRVAPFRSTNGLRSQIASPVAATKQEAGAKNNLEKKDTASGARQLLGMKGAALETDIWKIRLQLTKPVTWVPLIWGLYEEQAALDLGIQSSQVVSSFVALSVGQFLQGSVAESCNLVQFFYNCKKL